jgi:hypothetical protein
MLKCLCCFFALAPLLLLTACRQNQVCADPAAINYTPPDPSVAVIVNNSICQYPPGYLLFGNWSYTDTFTYYPPAGGAPQTSYDTFSIEINTYNYSNNVSLTGFPYNKNYNGIIYGDSLINCSINFTIHNVNDTPAYITFPDGLTNSAIGYLRK